MKNFLKRLRTKFVEPINVFEQLEERIVLNATINQVVVDTTNVPDGATATVDQGHATAVDADAADEGQPGFSYTLEVDGQSVAFYNANNGTGADVDVSTLSFESSGRFTWQPNNTDVGTHTFIVTANDGGAGAEPHTDAHSFSIAVQNVNDAPELAADGPYVLTSITENDTSAPVTVATIVGSTISDIDAGSVEGVAIYGETHGHAGTEIGDGTWQFSTDGQATWHDFPSVGAANALLLRAEDSIRYVGDTIDGETASLSYYAWDQTGATAGQQGLTADVTVRGNDTPFSLASDSATISVTREVDFTSPGAGSVFTGQEDNPIPGINFNTDDEAASLAVTYSLTYASSGLAPGWLDIDADGDIYVTGGSGTPENEQVGDHVLRVTAHTAYDDVTRDFTLQVTNRPAVFDPSSPPDPLAITFLEDRPFQNFDVNTDDESHGAAYDFSTAHPAWLTIDPVTGLLSVNTTDSTPTKDHLGVYTFTVKANDGHQDSFQNYELTVTDRNYFLDTDGTELRTDLGEFLAFTKTEDVQTDIDIITDSERDSVITHYAFLVDPSFGGTVSVDGRTWTSPYGLEVKIDDTTGNITANPINSDVGEQWFKVTATSGGSTIETRVQLTIVNDNRPGLAPLILNEETTVYMVEGSDEQTFNVQADDEGQDPRAPSPGAKYHIEWFDRLGADGNRIYPINPEGTQLSNGITINADTGVVEWDPTNADFTINAGAEHTPHEIMIVFEDGNGAQDDQVFQIYVSNRPIVFSSAAGTTWVEDLPLQNYDVETTEPDDAGGYVTYELRDAYSPGNPGYIDVQHLILATDEYPTGWVTLNHVTGELTHILGQPDNSLVGSYSFYITATEVLGLPADGRTYSTEQQFTLTIANTPPVLDTTVPVESGHAVWPPYEFTVTEGAAKNYTLELENPEPGAVFSIVGGGPDFNGALPGGQITFTPVAGSTQWTMSIPAPDNSDVAFYPLTLQIDDGNGGIVYQMFTLHVINKAPVITTTSATYTVMEDDPQWTAAHPIVDIQADEEGDGGPSYYRIASGPGWLHITNDGKIYGTPDNSDVSDLLGGSEFTVTFYDGHGGSDSETFHIIVNNNQPSLTQPASRDLSWTEDAGFNSYNIQFDDEGQGTPAFPYSFSIVSGPLADWSWLTFSTATGTVSGVPTNVHVGDWVFQVTFNDGNTFANAGDESNLATETITLHVVNTTAVFTTANAIYFQQGATAPQTFDIHTTDEAWDRAPLSAVDGNSYVVREINFSGAQGQQPDGLDTSLWLTVNEKDGTLTLSNSSARDTYVTVWFRDGKDDFATDPDDNPTAWRHQVIHVVVSNTEPPGGTTGFLSAGETSFLEDEANQHFDVQYVNENGIIDFYTLQADADNDGTVEADEGLPAWLTINSKTGLIETTGVPYPTNDEVTTGPVFEPGNGDGYYYFGVKVVDGGNTFVQPFKLYVNQVDPWWTTGAVSVNLTEDPAPNLVTPTVLISDGAIQNTDEGQGSQAGEAIYSLSGGPAWLTIDDHTGAISYDPSLDGVSTGGPGITNADVGSWNATITFVDGHGAILTRALPVTVQNTLIFEVGLYEATIQEDTLPSAITKPVGAPVGDGWFFDVNTDDEASEASGTVTYSIDPSDKPSWIDIDPTSGWLRLVADGDGDGPDNTDVGYVTFTIIAHDTKGSSTQDFTVTVPNRDPVYDQTTYETTDQNDKYDFHVVEDSTAGSDANVIDFRGDDETEAVGGTNPYYVLIPFDANGNSTIDPFEKIPDWVTIDPITGILTTHPTNVHTNYDPLANGGLGAPVGGTSAYQFVVRMYDLNAGRDYGYPAGTDTDGITGHTDQLVDLYVDNRLPQLVSTLPVAATEDAAYSFDFTVDDEGQAGTTYTLSAPAAVTSWLSIDSTTGLLSGNPTNADVGVFPVTILVNDQKGSAGHVLSQWSFDMTVINVDPTFENPPSSVYGTSATAYQMFFAEDADFIFIDMLSDDDRHSNLNNFPNLSPVEVRNYVYYTIETDPNPLTNPEAADAAPFGVRFVADATYPGVQPSDAYGYYESRTGLLKIDPNNSTVAAGGIVFAVTVHDGNGGMDKVYFDIIVTNTKTVFETGSQLQWYEDDSLNTPNVNTEDERFPRLRDPNIQYALDTDAPEWLTINATTGVLGIKPGVGADGLPFSQDPNAPDNHLTKAPPGGYDFHIRFFDGTMWIGGSSEEDPKLFHLEVWNDPTQITVHPGNQELNQDATMHITGAEVVAKDEYSVDNYLNDADPTNDGLASVLALKYTEDSYEIYVDWKDAGVNTTGLTDHTVLPADLANAWTLAQYNGNNDAWDPSALPKVANDLQFNIDTGEITWTPNNGDVYAAGQGHEFIIVHRDGHGTLWWENFFVKVNNVDPSWSNPIPDWHLVEDLANPADPWGWQKYDYLNTNEEGEAPFRYHLAVNGTEMTALGTTLPDPAGADQYDAFRSGSFLVIQPNTEGEYLIFNPLTGEVWWKPNNADVTRNIDPNDPTLPTVPGAVIRPDLDLHAWVEDGQGGASIDENIAVTVNNKTTTLTGSLLPYPDAGTVVNDTANPVPDITTVTEDRDERSSDKAFLVDVNADDEDTDWNNAAGLNARYQFEVWDDIAGVWGWRFIDPIAGYTPNTGGATITVANVDSGRLDWLPNNIDAGQTGTTDYLFRVTHFDGNNASDDDTFNVTVTNTAPDFTVVPGAAGYVLTEDAKVATAPTDSQIQIDTDDEFQKLFGDTHLTGVTYAVFYKRQDVQPNAGDSGWTAITGIPINDDGGNLSYDPDTGTITWETTNADVNYRRLADGSLGAWIGSGPSKYWFKVEATDHHDTSATSTSPVFEVKVKNVKPEILEVKYTDVDHPTDPLLVFPIPAGASATVPANATPFPEREDQQFVLDFWSNDEEIQTDYYSQNVCYSQLQWRPSSGGPWNLIANGGYLHPDPDGLGPLQAGGQLTFDAQWGIITWTPNNRDVGTWDFQITHDDANWNADQAVVRVTVANRLPQWEVDPPATWNLLEDDDVNAGGLDDWTISDAEVKVDDELLGATYSLVIDSTPFSGTLSGDWLTGQPNGGDGGVLRLNVVTGAMEWATRNADVGDYTFVMTATDQWTGASAGRTIAVHVTNETTSIQEETAAGVYQDIPATKDATEDLPFTMNLHARDEEIEASPTSNPHFKDAYYDLQIDGTSIYVGDPYVWNDSSYTYHFASGSDLTFDKETGVFSWTPNDSDVGTHTFVATHFDGQGDQQTDTFNVVVNNTNPRFQPQPTTVILTEDLHTDPNDHFTVQTDDETEGGVTYSLLVSVDGGATYKPLTGVGGWNWTDDKPNGALGGAITIVNAATGDFEWSTTNADTSYNNAGTLRVDPAYSYFFRVVAADTHGGSTTSDPFEVRVLNTNTVIDQVSFTGVLEVPADAVIPTSPDVDTDVVNRTATEDVHVFIDVRASDENHDNYGVNPWNRDARYEVEVWYQAPSGTLTYMDTLDAGDLTFGQSAGGGLNPGGVMTFNKDAGTIDWTPNNRDVGTWELRYTHIDANGDTDKVTVNLTVNNRLPQWEVDPPATWNLLEDDDVNAGGLEDWTISDAEVKVDDELVGATYSLVIDSTPFSGTLSGDWLTGQPNGGDGGVLRLNVVTGAMEWATRNADVGDYTFTLTGTDQWTGASAGRTIAVHVTNETTSIQEETAAGVYQDIPATKDATEDLPFTMNLHARDEEIEASPTSNPHFKDAYYDLQIDGTSIYVGDPYVWNDSSYTYHFASGSDLTFDKETGVFSWTPNDSDVGTHTFVATHYDGQGDQQTDTFNVVVNNTNPRFQPQPTTVILTEDLHTDPNDHFTVQTDDETEGGVTYSLLVSVDGGATYKPLTGVGGWNWTDDKPNGALGGAITIVNSATGDFEWSTTNADTSYNNAGTLRVDPAYSYFFRVVAADTHGGSTTSDPFEVRVLNTNTVIDQVSFTGVLEVPADAVIPTSPDVDTDVVNRTATEDVHVFIDVRASDENHDNYGVNPWNRDARYEVEVYYTPPSGTLTYMDTLDAGDLTFGQSAGGGLDPGGVMTFNKDAGTIDWTPNNRDVGTWELRYTHIDANGDTDKVTVNLTVNNRLPQWEAAPLTWDLLEDDNVYPSGPNDWTLEDNLVEVDDELTGATYSLQIGGLDFNAVNFPGTYVDGATGEIVGNPNGAWGGELRLNPVTGQMSWTTTNADVGNYTFTVTATDQWGGTSAPKDIAVHVANEPTVIDQIYSSGFWYETDTFHHATEFDSTFPGPGLTHIDARLHATDQEVERIGLDTYYDLTVNGVSWTAYNGANGFKADILNFNKDSGAFDWTPNNLDTGNSYTFGLTHYDANGAQDTKSFTLTVTNVAPTLTVPVNWDLYEDDSTTESHYKIPDLAIDSDQENLDLYYRLWIENPDGTTHEWTAPFAPNSDGGLVQFNTITGEIVWYTNNADVSVDIDDSGAVLATRAYTFTVQAWDNRGGHSDAKDFPVHVYNAQTSINDVPDQTVDEDSALHIVDADIYAADEQTGPEAYYTLEVVRTGSAPGLPSVVYDYHQVVTAADDYNKMVTATGGASIKFDSLTGEIDWAPKNPDVGTYTFLVTHHDGHGSAKPDTFDVTVQNVAPVFTSSPPEGQVVMATKTLTYDASTTDESQHDWRGDDNVVYSMVEGPADMTINPTTGLISWQADPALGGPVTVTIKIDDGNGGVAYQTFTFTVDSPVNDLPLEHRPGQGEEPGPFPPGILPGDESDRPGSGNTVGGLLGSTPMTTQVGALVPGHVPLSELTGKTIEEVLAQGMIGFEDLLAGIEQHNLTLHRPTGGDLLQPSLKTYGSIPPIVGLPGYPPGVAQGSRLDFDAEAINDWTDLQQPSLGIGGSITPHTPLEGHAAAVEAGQQLDFGYFPIKEAMALRLEDLKVGDLLGI